MAPEALAPHDRGTPPSPNIPRTMPWHNRVCGTQNTPYRMVTRRCPRSERWYCLYGELGRGRRRCSGGGHSRQRLGGRRSRPRRWSDVDGRRRVCLGELSRYRKGPTRMASARNSRMFADRERNPGATDLDADRLHEPRDAMIDMIDHSQDHAKPHEAQMPPNSQFVARGFRKRTQKKLCPFHSC